MKTTKNIMKIDKYSRYPYRIFLIGSSGSGKTNALLHLIKEQDYIDKIYLYEKDLRKAKYEC